MKMIDSRRLEEVLGTGVVSPHWYIDTMVLRGLSVQLPMASVARPPLRSCGYGFTGSSIYAVGGYDASESGICSYIWDISSPSEPWKKFSDLTSCRVLPATIGGADGNIYVVGGGEGGEDCEIYDPRAEKWYLESRIKGTSASTAQYLLVWETVIVVVFAEAEDDRLSPVKKSKFRVKYYLMSDYEVQSSSVFYGLVYPKYSQDVFVHEENKLFQICGEKWLVYDLERKMSRGDVYELKIVKHLPGTCFDRGVSNAPHDVVSLGCPSPGRFLFCMVWSNYATSPALHFGIVGLVHDGVALSGGKLLSLGHVELPDGYDIGRCLISPLPTRSLQDRS